MKSRKKKKNEKNASAVDEATSPHDAEPRRNGPRGPDTKSSAADGTAPSKEAESTGQDEASSLRSEVGRLEENLLRLRADYQNFQRRAAVERADAIRHANAELMRSLLGVLDDLERSLAHETRSEEAGSILDGVRLVYENLLKELRGHGLEEINALHRPFDPSIHEALLEQPSSEHAAGTVIEELAKGYRLRDRVLRPSRVIVSKGPQQETDPATPDTNGASQPTDSGEPMPNAASP